MQPNYDELLRKQQQDYQRSRDPFKYGQDVARRRYSEILAGLGAQQRATQQAYGDIYQQTRQQAVRGQAAGGPTLSGGMGQQQRDFVSALEMQQLGQIGAQKNQAMADLYAQQQAAFSNAQLEGQQATQMELQNRQAQLQVTQQAQQILNGAGTVEEKQAQLEALGVDTTGLEIEKGGFDWTLGWQKVWEGEADVNDLIGTIVKTAGVFLAFGTAFKLYKGVAALGRLAATGSAAAKPSLFKRLIGFFIPSDQSINRTVQNIRF